MKHMLFITSCTAIIGLFSKVEAAVGFSGQELLGRPTATSITLKVVLNSLGAADAYVEYGTQQGVYTNQTPVVSAAAGEPLQILLTNLQGNTKYFYRMKYRQTGTTSWTARTGRSFYTQRSPESTFTFTITSDSHFRNFLGDSTLYKQTMNNVNNDHPDFHIDLGDAFFMDGVNTVSAANQVYLKHRPIFDLIGHSAPIFLAMGNHENEEGWNLDDVPDPANSLPIMSTNARKLYFLNPVPTLDGFYTGNNDTHAAIIGDHLHEDYYAWQWGGALFVVIDPFFYTTRKPYSGNLGGEVDDEGPGAGRWAWTLGVTQFNWLKQTLQQSTAAYKFIFAHHMVGGLEDYVRGGAMAADLYEWGGENNAGVWEFNTMRDPQTWGNDPIVNILIANHVTAFFHGHDHVYAKEEVDGIVYQEVPMPSDRTYGYGFNDYSTSDPYTNAVRPNSGHLRITVSPGSATVKYIRAFLPGKGTNGSEDSYSYAMAPYGADNHPPAFNADPFTKPDAVLRTPYSGNLAGDASDPDGDALAFSKVSGSPWLLVAPNGTLSGSPRLAGMHMFVVRVQDGRGGSDDATLTIYVKNK
jgi:hypothetical protein